MSEESVLDEMLTINAALRRQRDEALARVERLSEENHDLQVEIQELTEEVEYGCDLMGAMQATLGFIHMDPSWKRLDNIHLIMAVGGHHAL